MHIIPLEKEKYDYFELHYSYTTNEHYKVSLSETKEKFELNFERCRYNEPKTVENIDTLYQDYWENAEAYGVCDDESGEILGIFEFATEEWNNRLRMTQLLAKPEHRGKGVGKFMVEFVKSVARDRDYRVIVLETQNYNTPAIDFYRSQGFKFCGGNTYFYSNTDIEDDEVMLEMSFLID